LAALALGWRTFRLNYNARTDELAYLPTRSEPATVFHVTLLAEHVAAALTPSAASPARHACGGGTVDVPGWRRNEGGPPHQEFDRDADLVQLLYTSGMTSRPSLPGQRGVQLRHRHQVSVSWV
jgi:long-subunit acyl-CoA synthetase (AMP-forming)